MKATEVTANETNEVENKKIEVKQDKTIKKVKLNSDKKLKYSQSHKIEVEKVNIDVDTDVNIDMIEAKKVVKEGKMLSEMLDKRSEVIGDNVIGGDLYTRSNGLNSIPCNKSTRKTPVYVTPI